MYITTPTAKNICLSSIRCRSKLINCHNCLSLEAKIIRQKISSQELKEIAALTYVDMVKGVADLRQKTIALGGELHADAEAILLDHGSLQKDLWGFNIYPDKPKEYWIEFTSLINIRPSQGNRSIMINDPQIRQQIREIINSLIG